MKCKFCDKELVRKDYETNKRWATRQFCNPECVLDYQRKIRHWRTYQYFKKI